MLDNTGVRVGLITADDARLPSAPATGVRGGSAAENADALLALLDGRAAGSAYDSFVLLNAAAAFVVAGRALTLGDGADLARESLQSGRARQTLDRLVAITQAAP